MTDTIAINGVSNGAFITLASPSDKIINIEPIIKENGISFL